MGDRRPSSSSAFSFRFWPGRRTPATQTPPPPPPPATTNSAPTIAPVVTQTPPPPPPATTNSAPTTTTTAESQATSRQSTTSTTTAPPAAETQTPSSQSTTIASSPSPPNPTTPTDPNPNPKTPPPSQPATTTLTSPKDEPKNSSPSSTKAPSPSKPTSPSRRTAQSRSPPQPSSPAKSPSRVAPQARSITSSSPSQMGSHNSRTPNTPQRAPQPRSPSLNSRSPKQTSPSSSPKGTHLSSPSKKSRETNQDISPSSEPQTLASGEKDSKPVASQQEPQLKAEVKSDTVDDFNGVDDGTNFKHNEVKVMPSKPSQLGTTTTISQSPDKPTQTEKLDSSFINGGNEPLKAMPEEKKEVKEMVQARKTEANEVTKKEVNDFLAPKSESEEPVIEKSEISRKPDEVHTEKQNVLDRNENVATSLPSVRPTNTTTSQPKKRSTILGTHSKSARTSGEHVSLNKEIMDDISTIVNQTAIGGTKNAIYDRHVSIITLAGENRGASMQMGYNSSKGVHIHRGYKIKPDENAEATTDGEGSFKGKQSEDAKATEDQPTEAYVNNNAQGINNSIVFNASIAERNPGVHMVVTHVPKEPIQSSEKTSPLETRKAEFNMSRAEKLTYEPTVRRRCLKGLLLETSDSDPENPEKPRRHGCRVGCQRKEKEDIDVL
ncbi:hypothetical protein DH2020_007600 [Rehmannia glutinosa]|uniref:Uncharacterized protein n=1 Tax=Rehmannia glutinosa TaxID=99300 RepID=A0ABR0TZF9_REHGL